VRVPYNEWWQALTGGPALDQLLGFQRNQFDRLVHFSYGLLLAYPVREALLRVIPARGFTGYFLAWNLILSSSAIYELIEWIGGAYMGGDTAKAFVGAQQDPWDSQKDMALAALAAGVALVAAAGVNYFQQRDFALEWARRGKAST
jgi:putative membrane protein